MGGPGSGFHFHVWRGNKKTVVEHCLQLDANKLMRDGILTAGAYRAGRWRWTYASGQFFEVDYLADTQDLRAPALHLSYTFMWTATRETESHACWVDLTTTTPRFGGLRWWFLCPLNV